MPPRPIRPSELEHLAADIRYEHLQAQEAIKASLCHAIEAGRLLVAAKKTVAHGDWLAYVERKCRLSRQTAQAYMKMFRAFGGQKASELPLSIREGLKMLATSVPRGEVLGGDEAEAALVLEAFVARPGDLWSLSPHRVLCGDATDPEVVSRLLGDRKPALMVTDPPYGIELDIRWREEAGLNRPRSSRTHMTTTMSGDTRADWSEAFALAKSIQVAYVWHASIFTREVLDGLLKLGFRHPQQIIWDKGRKVYGRTHYSYQHEPCWYLRKNKAQWFGTLGENSTIWAAPSPKNSNGGDEESYDHPAQKPIELMRRPILNHTGIGDLVYDPFLGSGTTLAAAEETGRICLGIDNDPHQVDTAILRWQKTTGKTATLNGRSFEDVSRERLGKQPQRIAVAG